MEHKPEQIEENFLKQTATALMTDKTTGRHCNAKLNYMSRHGMYFNTDGAFKSGNIIDLQFDSPPLDGTSKSYSATVSWCMLLRDDEFISKYGVGVKYSKSN